MQRLNTERFEWEHDYAPGGGIAAPKPSPEQIARAEQAIAALPWVQDGLTNVEMQGVRHLRELGTNYPQVLHALLDRELTWLPPQTGLHTTILQRLVWMSALDPAGVLQFVRRPSFETVNYDSLFALNVLTKNLESNPSILQAVLSHPALGDGDAGNIELIVNLLALKSRDPEAAARIESLPWVQDGITDLGPTNVRQVRLSTPEQSRIRDFIELAGYARPMFMALVAKSWVRDDISSRENHALSILIDTASWDSEHARKVIAMPFMETIEYGDIVILGALGGLAQKKRHVRYQILNHPAFAGGITDDDAAYVAQVNLELKDPRIAASVRALPWVQDGVEGDELRAFLTIADILRRLAERSSERLYQAVLQKPWVQDGISDNERSVLQRIDNIAVFGGPGGQEGHGDEAAALRIFAMPYLDYIERLDFLATDALFSLQAINTRYLQDVLSHPTLRDGIGDEHTALILVAAEAARVSGPEAMLAALEPGKFLVWKRTIALPEFGNVELAVYSEHPEAAVNLDWLEHAVRSHVEFMGLPLGTDFVPLFLHRGGGGSPLSVGSLSSPETVAHELAHYYWGFAPRWLQEGPASFMESVSENKRIGTPIAAYNDGYCSYTNTLQGLDQHLQRRVPSFGNCEYSLGSALFVDLYHSLGDTAFRQGFRRLYVKLRDQEHYSKCAGLDRGACYVKAAFVTDASPQAAAIALPILNRWYYGSEHGPP